MKAAVLVGFGGVDQLELRGGVIASVANDPKGAQARGLEVRHHMAHPDAERLAALVRAVAEGALVIPIATRLSLAQIREAQRAAQEGAGGKVLVLVSDVGGHAVP